MNHHQHSFTTTTTGATTAHPREEAERLLSIAEKLLHSRDLAGAREFALLAQETDPFLPGSDQIIAISDVILASEQRVDSSPPQQDYHSILQTPAESEPSELKSNYRRLALLLDPDKNKFPLAGPAFTLVSEAWAAVSEPSSTKKKLPVRRNARVGEKEDASFWTACPYCLVLYEYLIVYKECCIRCRKCKRAFHGAELPSLPPLVPGNDGCYFSWGFFPIAFSGDAGFPNWVPGIRPTSSD